MSFWNNRRWLGVGFLVAATVCVIAPQSVKAEVSIEPDGVMGQSIADEEILNPAEDYAWLSASAAAQSEINMDRYPMLRATSYTSLFLESSFTTVSDLNNCTYYHDNAYADCEILNGIDVSWWQADPATQKKYYKDKTKWTKSGIDWKKMHDAGADFVFVRAASRDTSDASIYEDYTASAHISGAKANKMNVGLYIFSQAINKTEAVEEADYVLNLIDKYDWDIDMPIVIDREAGRQTKRLTDAKLSKEKETAVVQAFADEITAAGYKAGVYASHYWYYYKMNADNLTDCYIWIARYNNMTTSYSTVRKNSKGVSYTPVPYEDVLCDYEFWQYSSTKPSASTGYTGNLDKNFWYKDTNVKTENLAVSGNTTDSVTLTWDDAGDAEQYRVYRYDAATDGYVNLGTVSDTTFTDTNLQPGKEYQYKVRCMWTIGGTNYFGKYSNVLTAITLPAQVENVRVEQRTSTKIVLAWDAAAGADGYHILQYNAESDSYETVATVGGDALDYEVTNLKAAGSYRFEVQAYKTYDSQNYWGEKSQSIIGVTKPGKVKNVKLTTKSSSVTLKWSKNAGVSGYRIYRLNTKTKKYEKIATVKGAGKTSYTNKKLKKGSRYSYKIRAYKTYEGSTYYGSYSTVQEIKVK